MRLRGGLPVCSKLYFIMLGLALLVYLISPIDLIPELIFGLFGLVDDILLTLYMVLYATGVYRTYVTNVDQPRS